MFPAQKWYDSFHNGSCELVLNMHGNPSASHNKKRGSVKKKAVSLFNTIAPFYGLFFRFQVNYYRRILERMKSDVDLTQYESVVDVGCGTGSLCAVLQAIGLQVTGVDSAVKMLAIAAKKLAQTDVVLVQACATEPIPLPDKRFDIAISSYTVHGMKASARQKMYREMRRLATRLVIFHDYNDRRGWITDLAEWLEGGDYFNFIKHAETEMRACFKEVKVLNVGSQAAWYVCTPDEW